MISGLKPLQLPELVLPLFQALGIFQREDAVLGDHVEQRDVDGVDAFAEDAPLTAFLPAVGEELAGVLEVVAVDDLAPRSATASSCSPPREKT